MKRIIPAIIFFIFTTLYLSTTTVVFAETNCTTDEECEEDKGTYLTGCSRFVEGFSTTWYCQFVHPEMTFCFDDSQCTALNTMSSDTYLHGCDEGSRPGTYYCRTIEAFADVTPTPVTTNKFDPYCIPNDENSGINTALGCIKIGTGNELIETLLRLATGVGGGIALLLILYGVFIVTTSAGMPDKLKAGNEIITSAVIGLIFILLSVFLVNLIGINILGIPGLT